MCIVPKGRRDKFACGNEIIQIGAVALNENYEETDSFMSYVHPQFGYVDSYIRNLTGISKQDTKNALPLKEVLENFAQWLPNDCVFIEWSDNDEKQLRGEVESKNIQIPRIIEFLDSCQDCQKTFSEKMNTEKVYGLSEALLITGIDYEEGAHDALVDARNTAYLFAKMKKEDKLVLSDYYNSDDDEQSDADDKFAKSNPLAKLLAGYVEAL